ncbi:hypothetical protein [Methanococcoides sp. LMO-2]|uniref:Uncharacterized protein n=1 Tax=Methanococcoides cohabitans TaxID=3136559 RepID=A0ABU9KR11_9EURY
MEVEISYAIDLPQPISIMNAQIFSWEHGVVNFTDNEIWFPTETSWKVIPFNSIEAVGVEIPPAVINEIRKESGYFDELILNYKKSSLFGSSYVKHSMALAGNSRDLELIRTHLTERIGFRANTNFEGLKEEETKLLSLLSTETKDINSYLPLISEDRNVLQRAFETLKRRGLVDQSARITQQGHYYLEQTKGVSDTKTEQNLLFTEETETQDVIEVLNPKDTIVQFTKKYEYSFTSGSVFLEDLWHYIVVPEVKEISLKVLDINEPSLHIQTRSDASINIESENSQVIFALEKIFNANEDIQTRLLTCLYLGISKDYDIANTLYYAPEKLNLQLNELHTKRLIESDKTLSASGLETIRNILNFERKDDAQQFQQSLQY